MCGVLPGDSAMQTQLRALGYREVTTLAETLFGPAGTTLRGHEFHWSDMEMSAPHAWLYSQKDRRGNRQNCGAQDKNVFASYIHLHFFSHPEAVKYWFKMVSRQL